MSKFRTIDLKDIIHGLLFAMAVAAGKAIDEALTPILAMKTLPTTDQIITILISSYGAAKVAAVSFIAYKFSLNGKGEFWKPDFTEKAGCAESPVKGIPLAIVPAQETKAVPVEKILEKVSPAVVGDILPKAIEPIPSPEPAKAETPAAEKTVTVSPDTVKADPFARR